MSQAHASKGKANQPEDEPVVEPVVTNTDAVDELLDEIDGVLEENAKGFVAAFVQKGGE